MTDHIHFDLIQVILQSQAPDLVYRGRSLTEELNAGFKSRAKELSKSVGKGHILALFHMFSVQLMSSKILNKLSLLMK